MARVLSFKVSFTERLKVIRKSIASYDQNDTRLQAYTIREQACKAGFITDSIARSAMLSVFKLLRGQF